MDMFWQQLQNVCMYVDEFKIHIYIFLILYSYIVTSFLYIQYSHIFNKCIIHVFLIHTYSLVFNTYSIHIFLIHIYVLISVGYVLSLPKIQLFFGPMDLD
jgi:cellulose synthase/poly-beta-1,6-N-acetylglucosamine synthase-like glycosyltransferase